jgi:hypothetical protein
MSTKFSTGIANSFNYSLKNSTIQLGVVRTVGKVAIDTTNEAQRKADEQFNADPNLIRCRIDANSMDKDLTDNQLANCYPLLPKHINIVPKVGEVVFIILLDPDNRYSDRLYFGPIISTPQYLQKDTIDTTALSSLAISPVSPNLDIDTLKETIGVFPKREDIALQGRDNADIILKENESLIRAGQHELNNNLKFNSKNPSYIQIRYNAPIAKKNNVNSVSSPNYVPQYFSPTKPTATDGSGGKNTKNGSVINIVSDKINILGHSDTDRDYILGNNENYISDDELLNIIDNAHPIAFGDTLLDYLKKLELAFMNHVHRFPGLKPSAVDGENYLKEYLEYPVETILSKNIKVN